MKPIHVAGRGFTLIEMAMVLLIVALLLGGGLTVLSTQIEQQKFKDTQRILEEAREALVGFAAANGRLPCPASAVSNGVESFCTNGGLGACGAPLLVPQAHGRCTNPYDGLFPGTTVGLPGLDANGYLLDGWVGRIRYAVTTANSPASLYAATRSDGIQSTPMATFAPDLSVCGSATGILAATCNTAPRLTSTAVAVILSLGANAGVVGGIDEGANQNADQVFVSHTPVAVGGTNGEFDDIVTWIPAAVLFNRMLQSGKLHS